MLLPCLLAVLPWAASALHSNAITVPTGLLVDFKKSPALGVRGTPHFTWIVAPCASAPDQVQTSYHVIVSTQDGKVFWDSGAVASTDSTYAPYTGPALSPSTTYTWTVATATQSCPETAPSTPATFVTSLLDGGWFPTASFLTVDASPAPIFGYFRKEFVVPSGVTSAIAHVTAYNEDKLLSGYKVYVNDRFVDLGPGRGEATVWEGDSTWKSLPYATLDLTPSFQTPGPTVIALQAMHNPPMVIFQVTLYLEGGGAMNVSTDASWQAFNGDLHRKPGPATSGGSAGTGFLEYIDARAEPVGWRSPGFSPGASWSPPKATLPTPEEVQNFGAHMKPPMQVGAMAITGIWSVPPPPPPAPSGPVSCGIVPEGSTLHLACPDKSPIQDVLFASFGTPTGYCPFTRNASCDAPSSLAKVKALCVGKTQCDVAAETNTFGPDPCYDVLKRLAVQLKCTGPPPPEPPAPSGSFVADFGLEFQGGLRLDVTNGTAGTTVRITCGENLNGDVVGYTWGWDFTWTLRDGPQTLEQHKYMECRFVSLTVYGPPIGFTLSGWRVNYLWDEEDSAFVSSNSTLDAVYNLCRYTVHSAALDTYTDSNTRERTVYEADGIIAASGRLLVQRDYLYGRHSHSVVYNRPTWPVEWILITPFLAWQDYMATGRPDLATGFTDLLHTNTYIRFLENSTGLLRTEKMGSHIVDWMPDGSESDQTVRRGEFTASNHMSVTNGFSAHGLELLAEMLVAGGRTDNATRIAADAASLKAAIVKYMWNGTKFCDGVCSEVGGNSRVMTNMFFLVFGLIPEANINEAWGVVADWGLEQMGDYGAFFYQNAIAGGYYSPYYDTPDDGTAIVTALAKCDTYSWCSGLLADNLTMTRESWHDGTYSHGWGSSAIVGVSWGVLGIHQTAPGFATFTIKPKLGPLTFANGTVPTLRGYITVNAGAGGVLDVDVPCNTRATLCTPRSSLDAAIFTTDTHALLLDGQPAAAVSSAGHLCLSKPVSCGAMGATRSLRVSPRS